MIKKQEIDSSKALKVLYFLSFFLALQFAFTAYINSTFLNTLFNLKVVNGIYIFSAIMAIIGLLLIPRLLPYFCNHRILSLSIFISMISLFSLVILKKPFLLLFFIFLYFVLNYFLIFSRDIFVEEYSKVEKTGSTRGFLLAIMNLGWVLAPLISGLIMKNYGYRFVYFLSFLILLVPLFISFGPIRKLREAHPYRRSIKETIKKLFLEKNIKLAYFSNFILQFFYCWMVIYSPIYLNKYIGLNWDKIGIIFTIMLIPFVLIQYPLGKLADKIGEKFILIGGFLFASISTFIFYIINSKNFLVFALILFFTRVGAATIEVMSESMFFRKVSDLDADVIGFFRNTYALSYLIAPLLGFIILSIFSFKKIFLILSIILALSIFPLFSLNKNKKKEN